MIRVLFFGDIVGKIGREAFFRKLPSLKQKHDANLIIVNGENSSNGKGITPKVYNEYIENGVDCITSGNHIFDNKEIIDSMHEYTSLIRPLNYNKGVPGNTFFTTTVNGSKITIINLLGQVFMPPIENPFWATEEFLKEHDADILILDIHAEATSEKKAMAMHFANRVSAVVGTHTHVQTNDAEIIDNYTAYITDIGMVGAKNSILGMKPEPVLRRFLTSMPERFAPPKTDNYTLLNYIELVINPDGAAESITAHNKLIKNAHA